VITQNDIFNYLALVTPITLPTIPFLVSKSIGQNENIRAPGHSRVLDAPSFLSRFSPHFGKGITCWHLLRIFFAAGSLSQTISGARPSKSSKKIELEGPRS